MTPPSLAPGVAQDITAWLREASAGDLQAEADLLETLYRDLHAMARRHLRNERPNHTLGATAVLHEAYVRVMRGRQNAWSDRVHFLATASSAMRHVLVDYARRRRAGKRGDGAVTVVPADDVADGMAHSPERVLAVDKALTELARRDVRQAQIVEMRFFAGMTDKEIADALAVSSRTVKRDWAAAKVWLYSYLKA